MLTALTMIVGVVALAAAAFVLSYAGVHDIARAAGLRAGLARFYPALPDALLVVACAAALALRNARWWARWFAWLTILLLVGLVGAADAVHAMAIRLPRRPTAAAVAILPWVLLLAGLQLWLSVLRHTRLDTMRSAESPSAASPPAVPPAESPSAASPPAVPPAESPTPGAPSPAAPTPGVPSPAVAPTSAAASPVSPAGESSGLDLILPPYRGEPDHSGADFAADLAVDADPEPDDPAADDYAAFDTYARPLLGAPVAEQEPDRRDEPTGEIAQQKADQPSPSTAADFRRLRSSPLPPEESHD